jgi:hypothetical protein
MKERREDVISQNYEETSFRDFEGLLLDHADILGVRLMQLELDFL